MNPLSNELQSFHKDRIQSNMENVLKEYSLGKRIFDKYDIEDNWYNFCGLVMDNARFTRCVIEACFSKCSFKSVQFLNCSLKTVNFIDCNLMNVTIEECSIESIDLTNSLLEGIKFGTNYAYGAVVSKII